MTRVGDVVYKGITHGLVSTVIPGNSIPRRIKTKNKNT